MSVDQRAAESPTRHSSLRRRTRRSTAVNHDLAAAISVNHLQCGAGGYLPHHRRSSPANHSVKTVEFASRSGKYPPAKPGALDLGPLKGADSRTFTDAPRMHTLHRTLDHAVGIAFTVSQERVAAEYGRAARIDFCHEKRSRRAYCRSCQTSTATPAEPGGLPLTLA